MKWMEDMAILDDGRTAREVVEKLRGIRCGMKPTSCPDQLSKALERCLEQEEKAAGK